MLHDMPRRHGGALVVHPEEAIELAGEASGKRPAKPKRAWFARREKVVKASALGMQPRPISIWVAVVRSTYALLSLGPTSYRSYYGHLDTTAAVQPDKRALDIFFP